jgi:acetyl esterase/lipase
MLSTLLCSLLLIQAQDPVPTTTVVYSSPAGKELSMDIFMSNSKKPQPIVLMFHGGGYIMGERKWMNLHVKELNEAGFAAATVSYRLAPATRLPDIIEDGRNAVRYVRANGAKLGLDPGRVIAFGHSAGAHMSLMLGYLVKDRESRPNGVITNGGVTDLSQGFTTQDLTMYAKMLMGKDLKDATEDFKHFSPINHVKKDAPPTFVLVGTADSFYEQSRILERKLKELGVKHEAVYVEGGAHLYFREPEKWTGAFQKMVAFLKREFGSDK